MSSIQNVQGTSSAAMASLQAARRQAPTQAQPENLTETGEGAALDAQESGAVSQAEGAQDNQEAVKDLTQYQAWGKPQQEAAASKESGMQGWGVNILA